MPPRLTRLPRLPQLASLARKPQASAPRGGAAPAGRTPRRRSALVGALLGGLLALGLCAPASWLAGAVNQATDGRLQLLQAQGPWWAGSALPLLTGGPGSRDAMLLPSRLHWRLGLAGGGLTLQLQQDCCLPAGLALSLRPGWGRLSLALATPANAPAQWPASWLEGLGAPWNTLKPGGSLVLASQGFELHLDRQGWRAQGQLSLELRDTSSRLATVAPLGSYRLSLRGQGEQNLALQLQTLDGALQLNGQGSLGAKGLKFRGNATAAEAQAPALNNLLNLLGRRQGPQSIISIG